MRLTVPTELWDYLGPLEENPTRTWALEAALGIRERAHLNAKLDLLQRIGFDLALQLDFIGQCSPQFPEIYHLVVKSQRRLRPLLCRHAGAAAEDLTFLGGEALSSGLHPTGATDNSAERRRIDMEERLLQGGNPRTLHERF